MNAALFDLNRTQPLTVAHPFEVAIVPASLTRGLPR